VPQRRDGALEKRYFPPAASEPPRRSPIGLLVTGLTINIMAFVGAWLISLLTIPYLPSFVWGTVEVAQLMATGSPAVPRTALGRWYAQYQDAQDAALDRLNAVSAPLPLTALAHSDLFRDASERDALRPQLASYVEGLHTWDEESQQALQTALAELDQLPIPPGSAAWVRAVIGPLEGEWLDRQSAWVAAETGWVTQVIDLYDWLEIAERRGARRLEGKQFHWLSSRDQQAYEERLYKVADWRWKADGFQAELDDWTAAQNPAGLWQLFWNWVQGYGLVPPPAPAEPELLA
jgi:hypothetical protein